MIDNSGTAPSPEHSYCFVLGCPRSGTTALTRLLQNHEAIVLGMERYKYLLETTDGRAAFGPELFAADRFLRFDPRETNLDPDAGAFTGHYQQARARFDAGSVKYVGDKVVPHKVVIDRIIDAFPQPRFVFIYRDLLAVANSYEVRARKPNDRSWQPSHDHQVGFDRWHAAFRASDHLIERAGRNHVFVVRYERLFNGDVGVCDALFDFLGLEPTDAVRRYFRRATAEWDDRRSKPFVLSEKQQRSLLRRADKAVLQRYDGLFEAGCRMRPRDDR